MALAFGTSGIRGLVTEFTEAECFFYASAFVKFLAHKKISAKHILVAGDLRASTPLIKKQLVESLAGFGFAITDGGEVPTPALAWACAKLNLPGLMITGSHVPADRNGFKFYLAEGEILKEDEALIANFYQEARAETVHVQKTVSANLDMHALFKKRYTEAFGADALRGFRLGFYEHSSVARDLFPEIFRGLGAEVFSFGRSETFVPVDTEAVDSLAYLKIELTKNKWDAIVSTDGDADRPLVIDDQGELVPGEILGLLTSAFLEVDAAVFPVSCSTILESSGLIEKCVRTKIGSPFVLGEIQSLRAANPSSKIAGFEANGGYLLASDTGALKALHTRDSVIPVVGALLATKKNGGKRLSDLLSLLPKRSNRSGLVKNFSLEKSKVVLAKALAICNSQGLFETLETLGPVMHLNTVDGLRMTFKSGDVVHLRPSGNAPEFRIYVEAREPQMAENLIAGFKAWLERT